MDGENTVTQTSLLKGAAIGALTSLPVIGLSFLGETLAGLPFAPFDAFDWLARALPGDVLTAGIDALVAVISTLQIGPTSTVAKAAEQGMAMVMFVAIGATFGAGLAWLGRRNSNKLSTWGLVGGGLLFTAFSLISASVGFAQTSVLVNGLWFAALFFAWGWWLSWLIERAGPALAADSEAAMSRRDFVRVLGGGVATITAGSWGLATLLRQDESVPLSVQIIDPAGTMDAPAAEVLAARIPPVPGTRLELTPNEDFYRIDINTRKPRLDPESWRLELGGLVDRPLSLTLEEIQAMPAVSYHHTLSCISNRIGGDLISTTRWTGVPVMAILEMAGLKPTAEELFIESADGFFESVAMSDLLNERTIFAYEMNGAPLPHENGYPLRIIIPNRYGMKQPKWISNMEVLDREGTGYWTERGWSQEALVNTTSVIDTVAEAAADEAAGTIPIGGIAHAGAKGISKVEVQVDDGPWQEVELRVPPLSPLTWVQWRYDWPQVSGRHVFKVRAFDGSGTMQMLAARGARPDGSTGVHEVSASI